MLTFSQVALASDICQSATSCELQGAGIVAIVASVLWFVCACLMFVVMKNPRRMRDDPYETGVHTDVAGGSPEPAEQPTEEREIKTVQNADGSTTTTTRTTVTNADGSKTVTTRTEVTPAKETP